MPKAISQAKAMSNSEKIKCVALAIIDLRQSEGIRQADSYIISYPVSPFNELFLIL